MRSVQSNIKIPLVLTVSELSALEERQRERGRKREQDSDDVPQTGIISSLRSFASALGYFSRPQAATKRLAWGSDAMTSQRGGAKVDCCVIIFLGSPGKSLSGKIWSCFCLFFHPVKNSRFVFGQRDRSWPTLPGDEINSAVDRGPCLSLAFIRCWCWPCERTTCTKKKKVFLKGERREKDKEGIEFSL